MRRRAAIRSPLVGVTAAALAFPFFLTPPTSAAPTIPKPGASCSYKEFWKDYRVITKSKGSKVSTVAAPKAKKADWLTCIPDGWVPEEVSTLPKLGTALGTWTITPFQRRPQLINDPALFEPSPLHDACRLFSYMQSDSKYPPVVLNPQVGLASYNRPATGFLASTGTIKGMIITAARGTDFTSLRDNANLRRQWWLDTETMASQVSNFYWNQSRGRLNVNYTTARQVIEIPDEFSSDRFAEPRDVLLLADQSVDFNGYDFVVIQFASSQFVRAYASPRRAEPQELDGQEFRNWHTVARSPMEPLSGRSIETTAHELGHLLGLPDLYTDSRYHFRFDIGWSIMGAGRMGIGFTGYERWILGWVPTGQVHCSVEGRDEPGQIVMSSLDNWNSRGIKLLMYPYSPVDGFKDRMRVLELRSNENSTTDVEGGPGLVSYAINASCGSNPSYASNNSLCAEPAFFTWRSDFDSLQPTEDALTEWWASVPDTMTQEEIREAMDEWMASPEGLAWRAEADAQTRKLNPNTLPYDAIQGLPGSRPVRNALLFLWPGMLLTELSIEESRRGAIATFRHDPSLPRN